MARKTGFANNWWSRRWIEALEGFGWDSRLERGRSYARSGRVSGIELSSGKVRARVQGSEPKPYRVTIKLSTFEQQDWDRIVERLASKAAFAAKLLAGEMPQDVEEPFHELYLSLFPVDEDDLVTSCSCPDWANPCKHVAAVHYILAAEFDRDPFLLFELRGRTREQIMEALRRLRVAQSPEAATVPAEIEGPSKQLPSLLESIDNFWDLSEDLSSIQVPRRRPQQAEGVLRVLGTPSFVGEDSEALDFLTHAYDRVPRWALEMAYGISARHRRSSDESTPSSTQETST